MARGKPPSDVPSSAHANTVANPLPEGKPVVQVEGPGCIVESELCMTTDANGVYVFDGVIGGDFTLVITAPVYRTVSDSVLAVRTDTVPDIMQCRGND